MKSYERVLGLSSQKCEKMRGKKNVEGKIRPRIIPFSRHIDVNLVFVIFVICVLPFSGVQGFTSVRHFTSTKSTIARKQATNFPYVVNERKINTKWRLQNILDQELTAETQIENELTEDDIICARGICVLAEEDEITLSVENMNLESSVESSDSSAPKTFSFSFVWPRALLLVCSILYGTNFPLGRLMNDNLPASAATSSRMLLATIALSPFLLQINPELRLTAMLCGTFTALGYVTQSVALIDTPAATVSFLGALVVIVPPILASFIDKKKMGLKDEPQTWLAAFLCLVGVGILELGGGGEGGTTVGLLDDIGWGDIWSLGQAVGFGTSFFITERMMAKEPSQALPITAFQCAMSALIAAIWAILDGTGIGNGFFAFGQDHGAWLLDDSLKNSYTLPGLFMDSSLQNVAGAALFTGFVTTAANRVGETLALGKVTSSDASVLLATEPLWAAVFANILIGESPSLTDGIGGALIVVACIATAIKPQWLREVFNIEYDEE